MTEEPDWDSVLQVIYENDIYWPKEKDIDEDHPVVQELGLEPEKVQNSLAFLSQTQLIGSVQAGIGADISRPGKELEMPLADRDRATGTYIGLTPRGFQVAHAREMRRRRDKQDRKAAKQQHDVNLAVAILTLGLISVTLLDSAVRAAVGAETMIWAWVALGVGVLVFIGFSAVLYRLGLLTQFSTD